MWNIYSYTTAKSSEHDIVELIEKNNSSVSSTGFVLSRQLFSLNIYASARLRDDVERSESITTVSQETS